MPGLIIRNEDASTWAGPFMIIYKTELHFVSLIYINSQYITCTSLEYVLNGLKDLLTSQFDELIHLKPPHPLQASLNITSISTFSALV